MIVDLTRSFSEYSPPTDAGEDEDWSEFLRHRQRSRTWSDLHQKPLAIVLGEAGIGKTVEFKNEAARLKADGKPAFFVPLNQLSTMDSWLLALTGVDAEYAAWETSDELGYFFLDAVDEARLKLHADFDKAIAIVQRALGGHLARVRVAISSRVTDWSSSAVRSTVDTRLSKPMERAAGARAGYQAQVNTSDSPSAVLERQADQALCVTAFVVELDPLSNSEARRCAAAFSLKEPDRFWLLVTEGDYEFMATRPLDLKWMVGMWNERSTLGMYLELVDANISNRLREVNESYEAAGEVLSVDQLRSGATELAAAAEFGGCTFFALDDSSQPSSGVLAPKTVLTDWKPNEVRRLMATAIFDEASYGRVKFHHRSVREYLAAQWVAQQMTQGVPLQRLQGLFAGHPFGKPALIASRRATLSWLAALNVEAREWVVRDFPELLLYQGDPQAWDRTSVDVAFTNYVKSCANGLQTEWSVAASGYLRVGRALPPGRVAEVLADPGTPSPIRSLCFRIAWHAKLTDCADVAFKLYRAAAAVAWERRNALEVLQRVGTAEQRKEVLDDLTGARLATNELIAHALPVVDWRVLSVEQLSSILGRTLSESDTGFSPMGDAVKEQLLPAADLASVTLLLTAVMASLPRPVPGKRFARFPESDSPERAWLLNVLPDCFERVLELLPQSEANYDEIYLEAAERIEALRDTGFTDRAKLDRLHKTVARHSGLRWMVALAIAQSDDIRASVHRLTWGTSCLVSFSEDDLPDLTHRANDPLLTGEVREIWFSVAMFVAFRNLRRRQRAAALKALSPQGPGSPRHRTFGGEYLKFCHGARSRRGWEAQERQGKAEADRQQEDFKVKITENLSVIRSGTHSGWLRSLLQYAFNRLRQRDYSDVDFDAIGVALTSEIADAFRAGLMAYWPNVSPPNPSDYSDTQIPWDALVALAGVRQTLQNERMLAALPLESAIKAAQFSVWELNGPPDWFMPLARAHTVAVETALTPWLVAEVRVDDDRRHRTLDIALRSPPEIRGRLLAPLVPLVYSGQVARRETLEVVFAAARQDGLLASEAVTSLCRSKLAASLASGGKVSDMAWLRIWMEEDATAAWAWFVQHLTTLNGKTEPELGALATAMGDLKWVSTPLTQATADVLISLHSMLGTLRAVPEERDDFFGPPEKRLRGAIPNVFLAARGRIGHNGLLTLLHSSTEPEEVHWIRGRVMEHAALDVAATADRTIGELKSISSPFLSSPRTEAQLFQQVIARLEEIRKNIQEGPFSERGLFKAGMPEKHLQLWLAEKFRETQNRRFSVHREEQVDDDKMTDIQLSCPAGNVCVEIKPVDFTRYSANSLTHTLRTQIAGQYLRGTNSSRGILVLMQLDDKGWNIPDGTSAQPFSALVSYLEGQAAIVKRDSPGIDELVVFGIRCIV